VLPPKLKERVVPFPVEGLGKATALAAFKAALPDDTGSWPQTNAPPK